MSSDHTTPIADGEQAPAAEREGGLFPIVSVGASAGGIEALEGFLREVKPDVGAAIVVVLHLDPSRPSLAAEILGRATQVPVREAVDGVTVEPGHVYVIPPNTALTLEQRRLRVSPAPVLRRASIDGFLGSLAEQHGEAAIGIVLSGAGSDGAAGLRAVKDHGGVTMAQDPEEAGNDGMPRSAIALGVVDWILPVREMAEKIASYASVLRASPSFALPRPSAPVPPEDVTAELRAVLALVLRKTGQDFAQYKQATMLRRVQRRMRITGTGSLASYAELLRRTPSEIDRLFGDLLIGVTSFFRDPLVFDSLAAGVIPALLCDRLADAELRFWVPGCATGEEAYSLAILVREALGSMDVALPVKLFATDIDEPALEFARQGRYPSTIADTVSPERLGRFFRPQPGGYQVVKEVRDMCVFSTHNLVGDPPFSRLDLISCRNVLIYLEAEIQKKLVPLFHYSLAPGGYLVLGPSENLVGYPELFRVVDKEHRIFRRMDALVAPAVIFPLTGPRRVGRTDRPEQVSAPPRPAGAEAGAPRAFERLLLEEFSAAAVMVNAEGKILYLSGPTSRFLQPPPGSPRADLFDMAPLPLRSSLSAALHRAIKSGKPAEQKGLVLELNGVVRRLDLVVRPMSAAAKEPGLFAVVFRETGPAEPPAEGFTEPDAEPAERGDLVADLDQELRRTRESLQATIEELEAGSEELQSANEELLSTNEELQSSNEELQTSKEEQQSINEELQTVNVELKRKVEELDRANGDLNNLFASTQIATLFLDRDLRIQRFSPAATELFRFIEGDIGRPVGDIATTLSDGDLASGAREVLATLSPAEHQVQRVDGDRWYSRRIRPYRSLDNVIEGVVITFVDVTDLKIAKDRLARLAAIVESSQDAIVGVGLDGAITTWNAGAERIYGYRAQEITGTSFAALHSPEVGAALEAGRDRHVELTDVTGLRKGGRTVDVFLAVSPVHDAAGAVVGVSAIAHDVTERLRTERALRRSEGRFRWLAESGLISIAFVDREGRVSEPNDAFLALVGYTREDLAGGPLLLDRLLPEASKTILEDMWAHGRCALQELDCVRRDGSRLPCLLGGARLDGAEGVVFLLDLTERRRAAEALRQSEERLRLAIEGTWELDTLAGSMRASPRARELWGLQDDGEVNYETRLAHVHPDDRRVVDDAMARALDPTGTGDYRCTYRVLRPGGEARWIESWGRAVFSGAGGLRRPARILGTLLDVTERKQTEEALTEADRRKDRFLAVLGHELRNPLAPIGNAVHVLGKVSADDPAFGRAREILERQVRHMTHLLDDLLDVGRIAHGKITLRKERIDLVELVRDTVEEQRPGAEAVDLTLTASLPERPLWMLADPTRVAQSVANLLVNAFKFTPRGGRVAVTVAGERGSAAVTVVDNGVGMEPEMIDRLFEPFSQGDRTLDRSRGGLGLGLSLVRAFVELHGGSVDARSEGPGKGSEFTLRLPLTDQLPPASPSPAGPARPHRVLVIEDNADSAELMQITLELAGHDVAVAYSGAAGMEQARAFRPTVVICDIGLPGVLDGYGVARALRADPELGRAHLIALSGYGQEDDKRRSSEAGFDDHLTKPVAPEALARVIAGGAGSAGG